MKYLNEVDAKILIATDGVIIKNYDYLENTIQSLRNNQTKTKPIIIIKEDTIKILEVLIKSFN